MTAVAGESGGQETTSWEQDMTLGLRTVQGSGILIIPVFIIMQSSRNVEIEERKHNTQMSAFTSSILKGMMIYDVLIQSPA